MASRLREKVLRKDASLALEQSVEREAHEAQGHQPQPEVQVAAQLGSFFGNQLIQSALAGDTANSLSPVICSEMGLAMGGIEATDQSPLQSNQAMLRAMRHSRGQPGEAELGTIRTEGGSALPEAIQQRMKQAFGHDFSHVRIHADAGAARQARAINARAFTLGSHIWFDAGEWSPDSEHGQRLLAHELTHVLQNDEGRLPTATGSGIEVSSPTDPAEREAYANEDVILNRIADIEMTELDLAEIELSSTDVSDVDHSAHAATTEQSPVAGGEAVMRSEDSEPSIESNHSEQAPEDIEEMEQRPDKENQEQEEQEDKEEQKEQEEAAEGKDQEEGEAAVDEAAAGDAEAIAGEEVPEAEQDGEEDAAAGAGAGDDGSGAAEPEVGDEPEAPDQAALARASAASARQDGALSSLSGLTGRPTSFTHPALSKFGFGPAAQDTPALSEQRSAVLGQLNTDAARSSAMVSEFVAQRVQQSQQLELLGKQIEQSIQAAAQQARAQIIGTRNAQKSTISAHLESMRAQATTECEGLRVSAQGYFESTSAEVTLTSEQARGQIDSAQESATLDCSAALSEQNSAIDSAYQAADTAYRAAAKAVADEARVVGDEYANGYGTHRTKVEDSQYSRRASAWREAAEKVVDAYVSGLLEEGGAKADQAQESKATDQMVAKQAADTNLQALASQGASAHAEVASQEAATNGQLQQLSDQTLATIDSTQAAAVTDIDSRETQALTTIDRSAAQQVTAIDQQAGEGCAGLLEGLAAAAEGITTSMQLLLDGLQDRETPDPEAMAALLAETDADFEAQLADITGQLEGSTNALIRTLGNTGSNGSTALTELSMSAQQEATSQAAQLTATLQQMDAETSSGFQGIGGSHKTAAGQTVERTRSGFEQANAGLRDEFRRSNDARAQGTTQNITALENGMRGMFPEMKERCIAEGQKAADKVKPLWMSVLKWVAIIAVVVVCAVVLGPLVAGLAAGLGPIGAAVVAGAVVGGISGGAVQIINNVYEGKPWHEGMLTAALMGAAVGALTGGIGARFTQAAQGGGSAFANFAGTKGGEFTLNMATDAVFNSISDAIQGKLTWESFFTGLALSAIGNGAKLSGPGSRISTRMQDAGARISGNSPASGAGVSADGSGPVTDGSGPVTDGSGPVTDGATPAADGSGPVTDGDGHVTDSSGPVTDGASPQLKRSESMPTASAEANGRVTGTSGPVTDGAGPVVDGPVRGTAKDSPVTDGPEQGGASGRESSVDLTEQRSAHILNRHRHGSGKPSKTEFPKGWTDAEILHAVSDVATDPNATTGTGKWDSPYATGTRDGVEIRVDFYPPTHPKNAGKISTAYPVNVPSNPPR